MLTYIFEFKALKLKNENNLEEDEIQKLLENETLKALEQIDSKKYSQSLINDGITNIAKVGVVFFKKYLEVRWEK